MKFPWEIGWSARHEAKLQELAEAVAALTTGTAAKAPLPPRAELEAAVTTLGQLWSAPTTTDRDANGCCAP